MASGLERRSPKKHMVQFQCMDKPNSQTVKSNRHSDNRLLFGGGIMILLVFLGLGVFLLKNSDGELKDHELVISPTTDQSSKGEIKDEWISYNNTHFEYDIELPFSENMMILDHVSGQISFSYPESSFFIEALERYANNEDRWASFASRINKTIGENSFHHSVLGGGGGSIDLYVAANDKFIFHFKFAGFSEDEIMATLKTLEFYSD